MKKLLIFALFSGICLGTPIRSSFFCSGSTESSSSSDAQELWAPAENLDDFAHLGDPFADESDKQSESTLQSAGVAISFYKEHKDDVLPLSAKDKGPSIADEADAKATPMSPGKDTGKDKGTPRTPLKRRVSQELDPSYFTPSATKITRMFDESLTTDLFFSPSAPEQEQDLKRLRRSRAETKRALELLKNASDDESANPPAARPSQSALASLLTHELIKKHKSTINKKSQKWRSDVIAQITHTNAPEAINLIATALESGTEPLHVRHNIDSYSWPLKAIIGSLYPQTSLEHAHAIKQLPIPFINFEHIYSAQEKGFHHRGDLLDEVKVKNIFNSDAVSGLHAGTWTPSPKPTHSSLMFPEAITKNTIKASKFSSFFPTEMNKNEIAQAIKQAFFNQTYQKSTSEQPGHYEILGKADNGMFIELYVHNHVEAQAHPILAHIDLVNHPQTPLTINGTTIDADTIATMAYTAAKNSSNIRYTPSKYSYVVDIASQVAAYLQKNNALPADTASLSADEIKHAKGIYINLYTPASSGAGPSSSK